MDKEKCDSEHLSEGQDKVKIFKREEYKCFVIMPFGKPGKEEEIFKKVYKIIKSANNLISDFKIVFKRADRELKSFELTKSVHKHINESHFCIADITCKNPNVLYEIGYAKAVDKEIILISQDAPSYPVDIANMIVTKYSTKNDDDLKQKLAYLIEKAIEITQGKTYSIKDAYEVKCFQNRKAADLCTAFKNAKERIDILQTNLATIERNYLESLEHAIRTNRQLKVRILTLDPDSYFAKKRADQLGLAIAYFREELRKSIRAVNGRLSRFGERFSLRIYDDFPTQITFRIDDFVYTGTVAKSVRGRELCTFMLQSTAAGVERSFLFHFESIWSSAREYAIPDVTPVTLENERSKSKERLLTRAEKLRKDMNPISVAELIRGNRNGR